MFKNWKRTLAGFMAAVTLMTASTALVSTASAASWEDSEFSYQENRKTDDVEVTSSVKVLDTKVKADSECKLTNDGLKAKLGASATTTGLKSETSMKVGSKDANMKLTGDTEVAKMSAKADAGLTVKDGKVDVKAGGGAELTALKTGGKIDANIGGMQVSGGAHVKLGIGAKAEVSYKNGKFKMSAGAALGIGTEFDIEIDVASACKAIKNGAETALKKTEEAVRNSQTLKDAMKGVKNTMKELQECHGDSNAMTKVIANATVNAAKYVCNTVVDDAKRLGNTVVDNAKSIGDKMIKNTVDAGSNLLENAKTIVNTVTDDAKSVVNSVKNAATSAWNWIFG